MVLSGVSETLSRDPSSKSYQRASVAFSKVASRSTVPFTRAELSGVSSSSTLQQDLLPGFLSHVNLAPDAERSKGAHGQVLKSRTPVLPQGGEEMVVRIEQVWGNHPKWKSVA